MTTTKPYDAPPGFDWVRRLSSWRVDKGALWLELDTAWGRGAGMRIEVLEPEIYRWTFMPPAASPPRPSPCLVPRTHPAPRWSVRERPGGIAIVGPRLSLEIDSEPWSLRFVDARKKPAFAENPSDVDGLGRPFVLPLGYIRDGRRVASTVQSFRLEPDEPLYGLGEKFTRLDKVGQRIVSWTRDALGSTSERSHKNIPFLWSSRGWGLYLDGGARITWELGTRSCQSFTVIVDD